MLGRRALPTLSNALKGITRSASSSTSAAAVKANDAAISTKKDAPVTVQQAPNYPTTWSTSQAPRPGAGSGPRFEQTAMEFQPYPLSAMELVSQEPVRLVQGRKATCDGGGGPLGHPKIYINLDQPGPRPCGYVKPCRYLPFGIRFEQDPHHHH
ncbi:ubiquinone oxidoreductase 20 kd subunit [Flammula alnicola]|nr:ubiquinone oxidoreductase 20 kd subunit [Flammula alnicola]